MHWTTLLVPKTEPPQNRIQVWRAAYRYITQQHQWLTASHLFLLYSSIVIDYLETVKMRPLSYIYKAVSLALLSLSSYVYAQSHIVKFVPARRCNRCLKLTIRQRECHDPLLPRWPRRLMRVPQQRQRFELHHVERFYHVSMLQLRPPVWWQYHTRLRRPHIGRHRRSRTVLVPFQYQEL